MAIKVNGFNSGSSLPGNASIQAEYHQGLVQLERRQFLVNICRTVAWGLLIGDALFTYYTLRAGSQNFMFAVTVSAAVAAMQWVVANAIYHRTVTKLFTPDQNNDGSVTIDEWIRLVIVVASMAIAYLVDFATNSAGIDKISTGVLLQIPFVSDRWPSLISYLLAGILVCADETIHFFCDKIQSEIDGLKPRLRERAAQLMFLNDSALAYSKTLLPYARQHGQKRAESENPDAWQN